MKRKSGLRETTIFITNGRIKRRDLHKKITLTMEQEMEEMRDIRSPHSIQETQRGNNYITVTERNNYYTKKEKN